MNYFTQQQEDVKKKFTGTLPKGPVLDWSSFKKVDVPGIHSVENLRNKAFTTSGRAAIYQALLQLKLKRNGIVLIPTYHCPTMVAPVLLADLKVAYFGLHSNGLPNISTIDPVILQSAVAIVVPHYFGLAQSLFKIREWCNTNNIALIEDCAHCLFGMAGEKPVGHWGDFATASLSKFLPVPEAGLIASSTRPIFPLKLKKPPFKSQVKGVVDVIELASRHGKLTGIRHILNPLFFFKNRKNKKYAVIIENQNNSEIEKTKAMTRDCDMGRIEQQPLKMASLLRKFLPRGRIIQRRRNNFELYKNYFLNTEGAKALFELERLESHAAPYVFPLWVDRPDAVYEEIRHLNLPVFRWDRLWPDTPILVGDVGRLWSRHVLQLLCHQDLSSEDVHHTATTILKLLAGQQSSNSY